ncbi:MAG: tRNA lysidine(34) synthetase TilS [Mariprofundaceae bacterium]
MLNSDLGRLWLENSDVLSELPDSLAVGWSGGADSTALLLALKAIGKDVQAWHVDHGWRKSSKLEAKKLEKQADIWGIPFLLATLTEKPGKNLEALSRQARYQAFQQFSKDSGVFALCLGHHRDDQAETVCMRLLQGAGVFGCRGMRPIHRVGFLTLFRPLLHVSGDEIRQVLKGVNVPWFEDPSNVDMSLWRNRIRQQLFPRMLELGYDPELLFYRWQKQAVCISEKIEEMAQHVEIKYRDRECVIAWQVWCELQAPVRAYVLQRMTSELLGDGVVAGRRHLLEVEAWTQRGGKGGLDLSRCRLMRQHGRLLLRSANVVAS